MSLIQDNNYIKSLEPYELMQRDIFYRLLDLEDEERERVEGVLITRARECGNEKEFKKALRSFYAKEKKLLAEDKNRNAKDNNIFDLELDNLDRPAKTYNNFLKIFVNDEYFDNIAYDELKGSPVIIQNGESRKFEDADVNDIEAYIERTYKLRHHDTLIGALNLLFRSRKFHPIRELIDSVQWDGQRRIAFFLELFMRCNRTEYVREVSRLIFHGGINRLYRPGCKFDEMPVLIGAQGSGKSTIVKLLAINEEWAGELNTFDPEKGAEALSGKWIFEVSELLALTKTKEQEAVKSFITRQVDSYRRPYDRFVVDIPRQALFVATTNKEVFLTDKTGNRRFLPVRCDQDGNKLHSMLDDAKEYILQCWAEAKHDLDEGKAPAFINPKLLPQVRAAQEAATEDDWREGAIEGYLEGKNVTCVLDLWENALGQTILKPNKKESNEIVLIMQKMGGWKKTSAKRMPKYGVVKCWEREISDSNQQKYNPADLFTDITDL